jgi:hypothetical protein
LRVSVQCTAQPNAEASARDQDFFYELATSSLGKWP